MTETPRCRTCEQPLAPTEAQGCVADSCASTRGLIPAKVGNTIYRDLERARAENAELRKKLKPYEWRPLSEIHEDFGPCVVIDIDDPGHYGTIHVCDIDFNESVEENNWTHFAEFPKLSHEDAEVLIAAMRGKV